jgi:hypothetical protein
MRFPPAAESLTAETFWQFLHGADQTFIAARIIRRCPGMQRRRRWSFSLTPRFDLHMPGRHNEQGFRGADIVMDNVWIIKRKENGKFDIFKNGDLQPGDVTEAVLERQLTAHGFVDSDYDEVKRQLSKTGEARISVPTPAKFSAGPAA